MEPLVQAADGELLAVAVRVCQFPLVDVLARWAAQPYLPPAQSAHAVPEGEFSVAEAARALVRVCPPPADAAEAKPDPVAVSGSAGQAVPAGRGPDGAGFAITMREVSSRDRQSLLEWLLVQAHGVLDEATTGQG